MGFVRSNPSTRCRYAACFALGFVVASLLIAAMFWILWCYMGLTIVQVSDTQRRAVVSYSYTTPKPSTTQSSNIRTEADGALDSSINAISKSPVTPPSTTRSRSDSSADLAKGDFAARPPGSASQNSTRRESISPAVTTSKSEQVSPILSGGEEGGLHIRKVSTSNTENRAHEERLPERDIKPTQTYAPAQSDPLPTPPRDERRPISRGAERPDEVKSSKPSYRDPDFVREPPRRSEPGRRRYDDDDDYYERGSPSRYDKRDRGRDTDDRYPKGDTRVYPDEIPRVDDRYPPRDSDRRRGDDRDREDRYRDRDDKYVEDRYRDRDDRDREDRYRYKDDRYRDDDRYEPRDRFGDEGYRRRDDRYDDRYRTRDDDYDDRYPPRDDRYDERRRDSTYDERLVRPRGDKDRYRDRDYRKPILSSRVDDPLDRKSERPDDVRRPIDYDRPLRDRPMTSYSDESRIEDRYPKRDRRPSVYDDRDTIYPSRTKDDAYTLSSTASLPRSRDDDRYSSNRDASRYADDERYISPSSTREIDSTRRDTNRDKKDYESLERRSSSADEQYRKENSRTKYLGDEDRRMPEDSRPIYRSDDDYPRRTRTDDDEYRRNRPRGDLDRVPDKYDRPIVDDDRPSRRYDEPLRRSEEDIGLRKDDRTRSEERRRVPLEKERRYDEDLPRRPIPDDRPLRTRPDTIDVRPLRPAVERDPEDRRPYRDDTYPEDDRDEPSRYGPPRSQRRDPFDSSSTSSRDVVARDKRYPSSDRKFDDYGKDEERPINAKDVIEAALKQSDGPKQNRREVSYPVFDPRVSNLTSTYVIPPSDRKGSTIMSRRRRRNIYVPYSSTLLNDVVVRKKRDHGTSFGDFGTEKQHPKDAENEIKHSVPSISFPRKVPYPVTVR